MDILLKLAYIFSDYSRKFSWSCTFHENIVRNSSCYSWVFSNFLVCGPTFGLFLLHGSACSGDPMHLISIIYPPIDMLHKYDVIIYLVVLWR